MIDWLAILALMGWYVAVADIAVCKVIDIWLIAADVKKETEEKKRGGADRG